MYLLSSASVEFLSIKNTYFAKSNWTAKKAREINIAGLKETLNKTESSITQKTTPPVVTSQKLEKRSTVNGKCKCYGVF